MTNQVNHPSHYNVKGKKECIVEIEESTSPEVVFDGCLFNIDKYMYRKGKKKGNPDLEDINKALWYCKYALNLVKNDKISKKDR